MRRLPQALISILIIGFVLRDYRSIGHSLFYAFFILLSLGASIEMSQLMRPSKKTGWKGVWLCGVILPISTTVMIVNQQRLWWWGFDIRAVTFLCLLLFVIHLGVMIAYIANIERSLRREAEGELRLSYSGSPAGQLVAYYATILYIGLPITLIILFSSYRNGLVLILYAMILTMILDTSSYLCGSFLARKRGVLAVSPRKSIAGYIGGSAATLIVSIAFIVITKRINLSIGSAVLLICATITAAIIGDLFESALKRDVQKKDSGRLVAGRGGLLDSIDSHLVAIPVFCALSILMIQ